MENAEVRRVLRARDSKQIGARTDDGDVLVDDELAARKGNHCRATEIEHDGVTVVRNGERLPQRAGAAVVCVSHWYDGRVRGNNCA